ncbi:tape measure protein [Bacteroides uniformis]|uniref:tape measure protein n=1 Tax=Bacteroides uniformis TaxID=820 RepID=UPI00403874C3
MLGDSMKAETIFNRIKDFAVVSPFQFNELASYTKQLSAYSIPYEELYDTTKRLADISAGVGVDMGRIILAYGQVRSAAFLRGQELRQFTEAGIPLVDELAKKFTELTGEATSAGEVFDKISRKEVSFGMVKDVLWDLTNEGGKFYNMQEALAESLAGKWSNLQDAWDVMMADIAESNSGVLSDSLELLTDLMKHWEAVANILGMLTIVYGSYKTAVILTNVATKGLLVVQTALNAAMKKNPIIWIITLIGSVVGALVMFREEVKTTEEVITDLNKTIADTNDKMQGNKAVDSLIDRYEALSKKANKSAEESRELGHITKNLANTFKDAVTQTDKYGVAISLSVEKMRKLSQEQKDLYKKQFIGTMANAQIQRQSIDSERERLAGIIREGGYRRFDENGRELSFAKYKPEDITKARNRLLELEKQSMDLANIIDTAKQSYHSMSQINISKPLTDWEKEANKLAGDMDALKPKEGDSYEKYMEMLSVNISDLEKKTKAFASGNKYSEKQLASYNKELEATRKIYKALGGLEKSSGNEKDPIAEQWKDRADLISKALSLYDKWKKIEGEEAASQRVKGVSEFAPIFDKNGVNLDLSDPSKAYQYIQDQLDKSKGKQMELYLSLGVKKENINYDNVKKGVDDALKEIERYISQAGEKWDLYKKLFEATGNKSLSMNIAFGGSVSFNSFVEDLQNQLSEALKKNGSNLSLSDILGMDEEAVKSKFGDNEILKLYQTIKEESKKLKAENFDNLLQMINDYKDYSAKIEEIERKRQKAISELENNRGSIGNEMADNLIKEVNKRAGKEKSSVLFDQFKESSDWVRIFDDLDRVSTATLDDMISKVEEFAKKQGLSIEDTKELVEALRKLRGELTERNPFKALVDSFNTIKDARNKLNSLRSSGAPKEQIDAAENELKAAYSDQSAAIQGVIGKFDALANAADFLGGVFENLGVGSGLSDIAGIMGGGLQGASQGMGIATSLFGKSAGPWGAAAGAALSLISGIAQIHDKSLERSIQRSKQRVKEMQSAYDQLGNSIEKSLGGDESIQRAISLYEQLEEQAKRAGSSLTESYRMQFEALKDGGINYVEELRKRINKDLSSPFRAMTHRFDIQVNTEALQALEKVGAGKELDNSTLKQYQAQYIGLVAQRAEIEGQLRDEEDKKKSDSSKIQDYKDQLAELNEQIAYFVEDLTKELYGIDFQDWAGQISNALVEAFANGEDAAKAFDNVVNNIMKSVANNILKNMVIQPMFEKLQDKLFGENGLFKEFTDIQDNGVIAAEAIKNFFDNEGKAMIEASQSFLEAFDKATGGAITSTGDSSSSGMSKSGIQASEETMNLTNSYLNGIRLDVSVKRALLEKIGNDILPKYNVLAEAQLTQLRAIANNTLRSAKNTEANVAVLQEVRDMFNMVINKGERKIRI